MTVELALFTWVWKGNRVKDGANCANPVPIGREQLSLFSIYKINFKKTWGILGMMKTCPFV